MTESEIIACFNIDESYRDDTAFLAARHMTVATDSMVEGTHFRLDWSRPGHIARKLVIANAADFLAAGASAEYALLNLGLTSETARPEWVADFAGALKHYLKKFGAELVGGDTFFAPATVCSLTLLGRNENPRRLTGFAPDQNLYLTGEPGFAYTGLKLLSALDGDPAANAFLERLVPHLPSRERNDYTMRALVALQGPNPATQYPAWIRHAVYTHLLTTPLWGWGDACLLPGQELKTTVRGSTDISDGLLNELHKITEHSDAGFEIDLDAIETPEFFQREAWLEAYFLSGEEYHLLLSGAGMLPGRCIGRITSGGNLAVTGSGADEFTHRLAGWGKGRDWHKFRA